MMRFIGTIFFISTFIMAGFAPHTTHAQVAGRVFDDISFDLIPETPDPLEPITVSIDSLTYNLDILQTVWRVNGEEVANNFGVKTIQTQTGPSGSETVIEIEVSLTSGETIKKRLTIVPTAVDLLWQADTYTPPFYRGKAYPTIESSITFTALPTDTTQTKSSAYRWEHNGLRKSNDSGFGAYSFSLTNDFLTREEFVAVESLANDGRTSGGASVTIDIKDPLVRLYQQDITTNELTLVDTTTEASAIDGITLIAQPYFFSLSEDYLPLLSFDWQLNNSLADTDTSTPNILTFGSSGQVGSATAQLSVEHPFKLLQAAASSTVRVFFR